MRRSLLRTHMLARLHVSYTRGTSQYIAVEDGARRQAPKGASKGAPPYTYIRPKAKFDRFTGVHGCHNIVVCVCMMP
jgi:hypothetical protein